MDSSRNAMTNENEIPLTADCILMTSVDFHNNDSELFCHLCKNLLISPKKCSNCNYYFCEYCFDSQNNAHECKNKTMIEIEDRIKLKLDKVIILCPTCQERISLFNYPSHCRIIHKKKCFNCDSVNPKSKNKKIFFLDYLTKKKQIISQCYKKENIPKQISNKLCFQIFVKSGNYRGFMASDSDGWMLFTRYRPNGDYFSLKFDSGEKLIQIYDKRREKWVCLGPHYNKGIGIYDINYGSIHIDPYSHEMISTSGRTEGMPLTLRMTDFYFFFYRPTDLYQFCAIELIYPGDDE